MADTKAVLRYKERRQARLDARLRSRTDAGNGGGDDESSGNGPANANNKNNRPKKSGGHGNTKLPFGLCRQHGIDIGKDWTPRDAWDALAGLGITPGAEFDKLREGRTAAGGATSFKGIGGWNWSNLSSQILKDGRCELRGDIDYKDEWHKEPQHRTGAVYHNFTNKKEMFAFLKEKGFRKFKDPETGETVDLQKEDIPRTVAKIKHTRYKDLVLGTRTHRSGDLYERRGFSITGTDFSGKRTTLKYFYTIEEAKKYAGEIGCRPEDLRLSRDVKGYATPSIG